MPAPAQDFILGSLRHLGRRLGLLLFLSIPLYAGFFVEVSSWFDPSSLRNRAARCTLISVDQIRRINDYLGVSHGPVGGYLIWLGGEDWLDDVGRADLQRYVCRDDPGQCHRGILRRDFNVSWAVARGQTVSQMLSGRWTNTLALITSTFLLSLAVAVPLGVRSALARRHRPAISSPNPALFHLTLPIFWFSLMLILAFGGSQSLWHRLTGLPFLPTGNVSLVRAPQAGSLHDFLNVAPGSRPDVALHLILPTIALSIMPIIQWSRLLGEELARVLQQEYIRTARAKGLTERGVLLKHTLRNVWRPFVTGMYRTVPGLVGALILTEVVFNWMGIGQMYIRALGALDMPVTVAFLFISAELVTTPAIVEDVLGFWIAPREVPL